MATPFDNDPFSFTTIHRDYSTGTTGTAGSVASSNTYGVASPTNKPLPPLPMSHQLPQPSHQQPAISTMNQQPVFAHHQHHHQYAPQQQQHHHPAPPFQQPFSPPNMQPANLDFFAAVGPAPNPQPLHPPYPIHPPPPPQHPLQSFTADFANFGIAPIQPPLVRVPSNPPPAPMILSAPSTGSQSLVSYVDSVAPPQPSPPPPATTISFVESEDDVFRGMDDVFGFSGGTARAARQEGVVSPTLSTSFADDEEHSTSNPNRPVPPPPPGTILDITVYAPILGVMFYTAAELSTTCLRDLPRSQITALASRPIVTFVASEGGAGQAGVQLGDICMSVNNVPVQTARQAADEVRKASRPLNLSFLRADLTLVHSEMFHMVKYDSSDSRPPSKYSGWKSKYVVVGGIIAAPHMIMMYRSKEQYDIAVLEVTSQRRLSVKVKEFDLRGARIVNDWNGPQLVHHKNMQLPLKYFVIQPNRGNPIKISSPTLTELTPVHEAVRRFIKTGQRGQGQHYHGGTSSYANTEAYGQNSHGDGRRSALAGPALDDPTRAPPRRGSMGGLQGGMHAALARTASGYDEHGAGSFGMG